MCEPVVCNPKQRKRHWGRARPTAQEAAAGQPGEPTDPAIENKAIDKPFCVQNEGLVDEEEFKATQAKLEAARIPAPLHNPPSDDTKLKGALHASINLYGKGNLEEDDMEQEVDAFFMSHINMADATLVDTLAKESEKFKDDAMVEHLVCEVVSLKHERDMFEDMKCLDVEADALDDHVYINKEMRNELPYVLLVESFSCSQQVEHVLRI
ncbi:hypothetical protein L7F22_064199 [Adiantum nelumboides]|nr:hypothetical protein [Adiantum nelumboides]